MWLWSRPWPYAWLWGSGDEFQKTASVTVYVTASVYASVFAGASETIAKGESSPYYLSASVSPYDQTDISWESAQVYLVSVYNTDWSIDAAFDPLGVDSGLIRVTAQISWILEQAGEYNKAPSGTYNVTISATPVLAIDTSVSADYKLSAEITDVTVSIFYAYSASANYYLTASVDAALQIIQGTVDVFVNQLYFLSATPALVALNENANRHWHLVWKRKKGYYVAAATST